MVNGSVLVQNGHGANPVDLIFQMVNKNFRLRLVKRLGQNLEVGLVFTDGLQHDHARPADVVGSCTLRELAIRSHGKALNELLHAVTGVGSQVRHLVNQRNSQFKSRGVDTVVAVLNDRNAPKHVRL